jgi:hypothetical protein
VAVKSAPALRFLAAYGLQQQEKAWKEQACIYLTTNQPHKRRGKEGWHALMHQGPRTGHSARPGASEADVRTVGEAHALAVMLQAQCSACAAILHLPYAEQVPLRRLMGQRHNASLHSLLCNSFACLQGQRKNSLTSAFLISSGNQALLGWAGRGVGSFWGDARADRASLTPQSPASGSPPSLAAPPLLRVPPSPWSPLFCPLPSPTKQPPPPGQLRPP